VKIASASESKLAKPKAAGIFLPRQGGYGDAEAARAALRCFASIFIRAADTMDAS
jgi:hypothetical protein